MFNRAADKAEQIRRKRELVRVFSEEARQPELSQDYGLEAVVSGLPEPYRQVVLLRYYGQLSCTQIGDRLDMPLGTVTKTLSRAYALLREALRQEELQQEKL